VSDFRDVLKKIELAQSDMAASLNDLFQGLAHRVHYLESASGMVAQELKAADDRIKVLENEQVQMQNQITAAHRRLDEVSRMDHRRIADLGKRIDDLENDFQLDNVRTIVADMINDGDIRLHID